MGHQMRNNRVSPIVHDISPPLVPIELLLTSHQFDDSLFLEVLGTDWWSSVFLCSFLLLFLPFIFQVYSSIHINGAVEQSSLNLLSYFALINHNHYLTLLLSSDSFAQAYNTTTSSWTCLLLLPTCETSSHSSQDSLTYIFHQITSNFTKMANSESPYKLAMDGPSRQLLWELGRLQILDREAFQSRLDRESKEKEALHNAALAAAAARHEQIWREAEFERKRVLMEAEEEEQRRIKMKEEQLEQLRRRTAEGALELKRQREETARRIEAEKVEEARILAEIAENQRRLARERAEAKQKADAQAAELAAKQAAEQAAAKKAATAKQETESQTAETDKKAKEAITTTQTTTKKESPKIPQPERSRRPSPLDPESHISPVNRAEHVRYLAIHQRSKDLRKWMEAQWAQDAVVKEQMGEIRRKIRKCVGQLTDRKGANTASVSPPAVVFYQSSNI